MQKKRIRQREIRHKRSRKKVIGTGKRPRLCVYRSLKNLSAQLINDVDGKTILSLSTFSKDSKSSPSFGGNVKAAELLGKLTAEKAKEKGVTEVVFDKGGRSFHGRVKAFADSARKTGLVF